MERKADKALLRERRNLKHSQKAIFVVQFQEFGQKDSGVKLGSVVEH